MTTIRTERRQRGVFGTLVKWAFIAFNVLMLLWIIAGLTAVSHIPTHSHAERVGSFIGATLGVSMILALWFWGDVVLGIIVLVTRGNKVIIEETVSGNGSRLDSNFGDAWAVNADQIIARHVQKSAQPSRPVGQPLPTGFGRRRSV